jgi:hypothetical protein
MSKPATVYGSDRLSFTTQDFIWPLTHTGR